MQTNALTRKAGPLPVYAYALIAVAVWFLFLRGGVSAGSAATGLPYTPASSTGSAAQQPASGQGSPADNANADLLSALLGSTQSSYDALLAALQYGGGGAGGFGGASVPPGFGAAGGGTSTAALTAPTVVDATPPDATPLASVAAAPPPPFSPNGSPYDPETGAYLIATPGALQRAGKTPYAPDAVSTFLVGKIGYDPYVSNAPAMTAPTPYAYVSPAPVDTTSPTVADPRPLVGAPVAV